MLLPAIGATLEVLDIGGCMKVSSWIDHVMYRGLLGSPGYYRVCRTLQIDGAIMRTYVSLNEVVWC